MRNRAPSKASGQARKASGQAPSAPASVLDLAALSHAKRLDAAVSLASFMVRLLRHSDPASGNLASLGATVDKIATETSALVAHLEGRLASAVIEGDGNTFSLRLEVRHG